MPTFTTTSISNATSSTARPSKSDAQQRLPNGVRSPRNALIAKTDLHHVETSAHPTDSTLYTIAEGDRLAFDQFWRAVADPQPGAFSEAEGRYIRATAARTALTAIARNVGFPMSPEAWNELSATWRREDSA